MKMITIFCLLAVVPCMRYVPNSNSNSSTTTQTIKQPPIYLKGTTKQKRHQQPPTSNLPGYKKQSNNINRIHSCATMHACIHNSSVHRSCSSKIKIK
ncbi:hypothetical protein CC80DRAFT_262349 [Byssothecium circinans]|uniref:Secreted protein n=1 Tax=Byssothecium circinans TaxID=147558 RepID=A0A6A5U7J5_9PLEO|nr:hypothetical protein CC80DRAFT_262349 [Byssothecium circinans]